ncbi:MAG: hypothetical protein A2Z21_07360 [Candidatus Fraserbacteria bacterium RBG_16_55_9]|uniref:DUF2007 domain-containing protein n=1 Tax=Fraserbacteria sp. (strain RBG_16_55_9) TaxID=1817864 RepID=A0A1F5V0G6_FRAXR|nr:MAG: hypothetical protein A2Z21_07360 [Candidatus Fraserbacteria bacterium RBG_16_55_9]
MKRVYVAESPQEAHLVKEFLEANGISAVVEGQHLQAVMGGIPIPDTYPWVSVSEEDYDEAKALIAQASAADQPSSDSSSNNVSG